MSLGTSNEVFLVGKVEEQSRTEGSVNLYNTVSEGFFVDVQCQCQWKHVPELK